MTLNTPMNQKRSLLILLFTVLCCDRGFADTRSHESPAAVEELKVGLNSGKITLDNADTLPSAKVALLKADAESVRELLEAAFLDATRTKFAEQWKSRTLKTEQHEMPFFFKRFGQKPADGWSLYISLHGGGGAPKRVNDQQWQNQKRLYSLKEGIYCAPRAPTDTWNLWHQSHIDVLFDRLIRCMVAFEQVDWNRVYVMGYSAGGDGVYQLAPRMADRWAAAAMMAGHPNETSPIGLRNVPFALQVGGKDSAYKRNKIALEWEKKLADLKASDGDGYEHLVKVYPNKGHWMDRKDAIALPWMAKFTRKPWPKRIVWKQDDVIHPTYYWLGVSEANQIKRTTVTASIDGQTIELESDDVSQVTIYLDDRFVDLEKPIKILWDNKVAFEGKATRTIENLAQTFRKRGDPSFCFCASVTVTK